MLNINIEWGCISMNNEIILQRLKRYFPVPVDLRRSVDYAHGPGGKAYDFFVRGSQELVGRCELNRFGRLVHFERLMGMVLTPSTLEEKDLINIAWTFVKQFYPDIIKEYKLSTIFNLREIYSIYFEKMDERLGVPIPYIGFNVGVGMDGQIADFSFDYPEYEVKYFEEMISTEEAKQKYLNNIELELAFEYCDRETYINGDNNYHLLYKVNRRVATVPANGKLRFIPEREQYDYLPIKGQKSSFTSLYEALGINDKYHRLGRRDLGTGKIEVWSRLFQTNQFEYSMFMPEDHILKIAYDWDGRVKHILSGEFTPRLMDKMGIERAQEIALDFLFFVEPDADQKFLLREIKDSPFEGEEYFDKFASDEEGAFPITPQQGYEEMYRFLFQRVKSGFFVLDNFITIGIGKYSGSVRMFENTVKSEAALKHVNIEPKLEEEAALKLYEEALKMELTLLPQFEGRKRVYSPGYLAKFSMEHHYVEAIDAETGKLYEIDLNDPIPY